MHVERTLDRYTLCCWLCRTWLLGVNNTRRYVHPYSRSLGYVYRVDRRLNACPSSVCVRVCLCGRSASACHPRNWPQIPAALSPTDIQLYNTLPIAFDRALSATTVRPHTTTTLSCHLGRQIAVSQTYSCVGKSQMQQCSFRSSISSAQQQQRPKVHAFTIDRPHNTVLLLSRRSWKVGGQVVYTRAAVAGWNGGRLKRRRRMYTAVMLIVLFHLGPCILLLCAFNKKIIDS